MASFTNSGQFPISSLTHWLLMTLVFDYISKCQNHHALQYCGSWIYNCVATSIFPLILAIKWSYMVTTDVSLKGLLKLSWPRQTHRGNGVFFKYLGTCGQELTHIRQPQARPLYRFNNPAESWCAWWEANLFLVGSLSEALLHGIVANWLWRGWIHYMHRMQPLPHTSTYTKNTTKNYSNQQHHVAHHFSSQHCLW